MDKLRSLIFVSAILLVAFLVGYKGDRWYHSEMLSSTWNRIIKQQHASPPPPTSAEANSAIDENSQNAVQPVPTAAVGPTGLVPNAAPNAAPPGTPGLAGLIDSIRPGQPNAVQHEKRNLYFEHLSRQLQELKGEPPPAQPPSELNPKSPTPFAAPPVPPSESVAPNSIVQPQVLPEDAVDEGEPDEEIEDEPEEDQEVANDDEADESEEPETDEN